MGKIAVISFAVIVLAALSMLGGCSNTACLDNKSAIPLAGFYSMATRHSIAVDSLQIGGVDAPDDSLLVDIAAAQEVYLPMRSSHTTTSFFIHYATKAFCDPRLNDTLTFDYIAEPYFASDECGAMYVYRVNKLTYTKHLIDSVGIVDSLITNVNKRYIQIFFRTVAEEAAAL